MMPAATAITITDLPVTIISVRLAIIDPHAASFAGSGITRLVRHATSPGPNRLCSSNQRSSRSELFENAHSEIRRNGVVGKTGKNAPSTPSPTNSRPMARYAARSTELALDLLVLGIEQRLDALDLRPGEVDGIFDERTRRAIRRFQTARGLPETGYLDQSSMVGLLAGGVLKMGE